MTEAPPMPPRVGLGGDPGTNDPTALAWVEQLGPAVFTVRKILLRKKPAELDGDEAANWMCLQIAATAPCAVDVVTVEGQEVYRGAGGRLKFGGSSPGGMQIASAGRGKPDGLIRLSRVTGAIICRWGPYAKHVLTPLPKTWKGSVKKWIPQRRVCEALGWGWIHHETKDGGWCEPTGPGNWSEFGIKGSQWSHVLDAIGLAIWGLRKTA